MTDPVIISGGGLTGLMLASELRLWGVPAVVLERTPVATGQSPGQAINISTAELLHQRGLLDDLRQYSSTVEGMHFALMWLDVAILDDSHQPAMLLGHHHIERHLEQHVLGRGAEVRRGHQLVGFVQDSYGVQATVLGPDGEYSLRGSYLVGADGERSLVRRLAGIDFPGSGQSNCGLVADIQAGPADLPEAHRGSKFCPAGGIYSAVPVEPGVLRVITAEFDVTLPDIPPAIDDLRASVLRLTGTEFPDVPLRWIRRYGGPTRVADRMQSARVFLAGDSAHTFYPLAGMRLNLCLDDAVNLGWKLAADLHGWAPPGLLDSYHTERHPHAVRAAMATDTQLALIHPAEKVRPLRAFVTDLLKFPDVNRYLLELTTGLDVGYAQPGTVDLRGRRLPQLPLTTAAGPTDVAELLHRGRGVYLDLSGTGAPVKTLAGLANRLEVVVAEPVAEIHAAAVLVRPDGHVAWAGEPDGDAEGLSAAVKQWFGSPSA